MRQTMPEDRIIKRDREGDEARLSELRKTDQALKRQTVTAVRTPMWRNQDVDVAQKETIMTDRSLDPSGPLTRYFDPTHYGIPKSAGAAANIAHHKGG